MTPKKRFPRVEDLVLPRLLQALGEAENVNNALKRDEHSSTLALHPIMRGLLSKETGPQIMFGLMAKTSVLFVVDYDEYAYAVSSAYDAPVLPELPPLPYPRISVECADDHVWPMAELGTGEPLWELEMFTINETIRGEEWAVCMLHRTAGSTKENPEMFVLFFSVKSDGSVTFLEADEEKGKMLPPTWTIKTEQQLREHAKKAEQIEGLLGERRIEGDDPHAALYRAIPVEFAHLINARGVEVEEIPLARAQRRRFSRSRLVHPKVYFVVVGETSVSEREGRSDREYHCRWLVRGHWRRFENGTKTWVRPYIKGPAGAPWRGRPIYITREAVEAR